MTIVPLTILKRRFHSAGAALLALLMAAVLSGCTVTSVWVVPSHTRGPATIYLGTALVSDMSEVSDFGYYIYLVIQPTAKPEQRKAAARAFMSWVRAAELVEQGVNRQEMALLVAPIRASTNPHTADELLASYNAAVAQVVVQKVSAVGLSVPPVALVASRLPILPNTALEKADLHVAPACGNTETVIRIIAELQQQLSKKFLAPERTLASRLRDFFDVVGELVLNGEVQSCK